MKWSQPRPAAFSFVMATGIVAIAARQQQLAPVATFAFALTAVAWAWLTIAFGLRMVRERSRVGAEMRDHAVAPGFFTAVAGTAVLAANLLLWGGALEGVAVLAAWAAALWLALTYGIFTLLTTRDDKPPLASGLNGGWLLAVVATQSIAVIGALLSPRVAPALQVGLDFAALALWLFGGMLYTWIIALIFFRWLFLRLAPGDLTPAYWINMGAMAISTLAGSLLASDAPQAPWLHALRPFVEGGTVLCWATATWWLPLLAALTVWRLRGGDGSRAGAVDWSMVFPLGMYSAATHQMQNALRLPFLGPVASAFCWIAIAAWLVTAAAGIAGSFNRS